MRYSICLCYDGAEFCGWQIQPSAPSVQQCLEGALSRLLNRPVSVTGAGRTDTAVNALGFVAHFDLDGELPFGQDDLCYKLNAILPHSVAVFSVTPVADDFHARYSAKRREYTYFIHRQKDPFVRSYSWQCGYPVLDFDAMNAACQYLLGTHDFSCFEKTGTDVKTSICTIYEAFCNEFGQDNVRLCQGVTYNEKGKWWEENEPDIAAAVRAAQGVDVIVACIGENSYTETPGNLTDLTLSENQRNLVKALAKTGKPIVLVLNEGRPRILADIEPLAQAVVHIMIPGNYGGDALAGLLSGRYNFSGRLPFTYPSDINSLTNYDFKKSEETGTMEGAYDYNARITQQWGFGYGLSYTTFEYSNMQVDKQHFTKDDVLNISIDISNKGDRVGKESVLLFSSDLIASMVPDGRRLREFQKVELQPGETKTVTFALPASDLAFVGYDGRWTLEEGDFLLSAGQQTVSITCDKTFVWSTPNL